MPLRGICTNKEDGWFNPTILKKINEKGPETFIFYLKRNIFTYPHLVIILMWHRMWPMEDRSITFRAPCKTDSLAIVNFTNLVMVNGTRIEEYLHKMIYILTYFTHNNFSFSPSPAQITWSSYRQTVILLTDNYCETRCFHHREILHILTLRLRGSHNCSYWKNYHKLGISGE